MKKSAYYSDLFFAFSLTAFTSLFLLRFLGVKLLLSIPPSLCLGVVCSILLSFHLKRKQKIFALKKSEEIEKNALFLYLCIADTKEVEDFLIQKLPLLINGCEEKTIHDEEPTPTKNGAFVYQGKYFIYKFSFREVSEDDVAEIAKTLRGVQSPILLCDKISNEGRELCDKLAFTVIEGAEIYRTLKDKNALPQNLPSSLPVTKASRRQICFAKNNSKRFFKSGILLSVFSFFTPYSIYYAVTACLLFLVSILVRIYGYR